MKYAHRAGYRVVAATVATVAVLGGTLHTQGDVQPVNEGPNPYQTTLNWAQVTAPRTFGSTAGIFVDKDGRSIWVADRCGDKPGGGFGGDGCALTPEMAPVMKFDASGKMVASIGAGMFIFPHGTYVDPDGNIWVTDQRGANAGEIAKVPGAKALGHRAIKFSPDGKVLLVLGKGGVAGNPPDALTEPLDVVTGRNGDIFVSEGHCGQNANAAPDCVARISKFDRNGKYIKSWGKMGTGIGELKTPHALAMDSRGRLVVTDRGNHRLQIFDQDGNFVEQVRKFGRVSDIFIDRNDLAYAIDSESNDTNHPGWKKGVRIGSLRDDRTIQFFIPGHQTANGQGTAGEGVTVDAAGNIFGAENGLHSVTKYTKP